MIALQFRLIDFLSLKATYQIINNIFMIILNLCILKMVKILELKFLSNYLTFWFIKKIALRVKNGLNTILVFPITNSWIKQC